MLYECFSYIVYSRGVANAFRLEVIGHSKDTRSPIKNIGSTSFMYILVGGVSGSMLIVI